MYVCIFSLLGSIRVDSVWISNTYWRHTLRYKHSRMGPWCMYAQVCACIYLKYTHVHICSYMTLSACILGSNVHAHTSMFVSACTSVFLFIYTYIQISDICNTLAVHIHTNSFWSAFSWNQKLLNTLRQERCRFCQHLEMMLTTQQRQLLP